MRRRSIHRRKAGVCVWPPAFATTAEANRRSIDHFRAAPGNCRSRLPEDREKRGSLARRRLSKFNITVRFSSLFVNASLTSELSRKVSNVKKMGESISRGLVKILASSLASVRQKDQQRRYNAWQTVRLSSRRSPSWFSDPNHLLLPSSQSLYVTNGRNSLPHR